MRGAYGLGYVIIIKADGGQGRLRIGRNEELVASNERSVYTKEREMRRPHIVVRLHLPYPPKE